MPDSTNTLPMGQGGRPECTPKIKVIFRGFVISRIKHNVRAMVGALDAAHLPPIPDALCHQPIIQIYKTNSQGVTTLHEGFVPHLDQDFTLDVRDNPRIEVFQKDDGHFNRLDEVENDKKDFRWVVDFNEIHDRPATQPVVIQEEKLKPRFIFNSGVFHASKLSDGEVKKRLLGSTERPPRFGRFAMEITARIVLVNGNQATLRNGSSELTIRDDDPYRYEIVFDCTCRSAAELDSDFHSVYEVVKHDADGHDIPNQVSLDPAVYGPLLEDELDRANAERAATAATCLTSVFRKTPEVYCFGGNCTNC